MLERMSPVFPTTLGAKNISRGIQYLVNNPSDYTNAAWLVAPGNTNPQEQPRAQRRTAFTSVPFLILILVQKERPRMRT